MKLSWACWKPIPGKLLIWRRKVSRRRVEVEVQLQPAPLMGLCFALGFWQPDSCQNEALDAGTPRPFPW